MAEGRLLGCGLGLLALLTALALAAPLTLAHDPNAQLDAAAGQHLPPGSARWLVVRADGRSLLAEQVVEGPSEVVVTRLGRRESLARDEIVPAADGRAARRVRFWLGSDRFGRDLLARLLAGARISLGVGVLALAVSLFLGLAVGALAALGGPLVDALAMRAVDGLLAFPRLFLALAAAALFGPGLGTAVAVLGLTGWMGVARLVRSELLAQKERDYILAARGLGLSPWRIFWRHLLPNSVTPVLIDATLRLGDTILVEAALSFLGLGVQPPRASWGNLIADGREVLASAWWVAAFPGAALVVAVLAANLIGEGLRDRLSPRRERHGGPAPC